MQPVLALLLIFTAAMASVASSPVSRPDSACDVSYSSLEARRKFEFLIQSGFLSFYSNHPATAVGTVGYGITSSVGDPQPLVEIARAARRLKPADRKRMISKVRNVRDSMAINISAKGHERANDVREFAHLALYDGAAWDRFLGSIRTQRLKPEWEVAIPELLAVAPPKIKDKIRYFISQHYPDAVHAKNRSSVPAAPSQHRVSRFAKRGFDFILRHLYRNEILIEQGVSEGRLVLEAYDQYLNAVHEDLKLSSVRYYDAHTVYDVAVMIQTVLARLSPKDEIVIGGSFANGRAIPGASDIDLFSKITGSQFPAEVDRELRDQIAQVLQEHKLPRLRVSREEMNGPDIAQLSEPSPVAIRIRHNQIDLLVYPPQPNAGTVRTEDFAEPRVYPMLKFGQN